MNYYSHRNMMALLWRMEASRRIKQEEGTSRKEEEVTSTSDPCDPPLPAESSGEKLCRCGDRCFCTDPDAYFMDTKFIKVLWDADYCKIPEGKSVVDIAQAVRDKFCKGFQENEFAVVFDVRRDPQFIAEDFKKAQITVLDYFSQRNREANVKLIQKRMLSFAETHSAGDAVVLISGDINFAPELCELKQEYKMSAILVHNDGCPQMVMKCASETHSYSRLLATVPDVPTVPEVKPSEVKISYLPPSYDPNKVRAGLERLTKRYEGRVWQMEGTTATLRFPSEKKARAAKQILEDKHVYGGRRFYGSKIRVNPVLFVAKPCHYCPHGEISKELA